MKNFVLTFTTLLFFHCSKESPYPFEQKLLEQFMVEFADDCIGETFPDDETILNNPEKLEKHIQDHKSRDISIIIHDSVIIPKFKIDFSSIEFPPNIQVKLASEVLPELKNNIYYLENFECELVINRIEIYENRISGFIDYSVACGPQCRQGIRVQIKLINDTWEIIEYQNLWVS